MSIEDWTDEALEILAERYRARGIMEGGKYSLQELLREQLRRRGGTFSGRDVTSRILELARRSSDGLTTYGELWDHLYPGKEWTGQNNIRMIGKDLDSAVYYCITNGLPIITVLVVPANGRKLTDKAVLNIYERSKELGVDTGPSQTDFIQKQTERALELNLAELPE